jgi:purine-binding chemotaxis protein CheW
VHALVLPVAGDAYALRLEDVREVVPRPALAPLPGAPSSVLGVMNLRGDVVPVLDTAALLGTGRVQVARYVAVTETPRGLAGLAGDGEPRTATLGERAGASELPDAVGRYAFEGGIISLLALTPLLDPARVAGA